MLVRDGKLSILCRLPVSTIMASPEFVRMGVEQYFNTQQIAQFLKAIHTISPPQAKANGKDPLQGAKDKMAMLAAAMSMPTPEEYARAMGFCNFAAMRKAIESPEYDEASRHYLMIGCSVIADMLTRAGLGERMNTKFTQFVMSAYLGINEKTELYKQEDTTLRIEWGALPYPMTNPKPLPKPDDPAILMLPEPPDALDVELDRLEKALPESMKLQSYKMAVTQPDMED